MNEELTILERAGLGLDRALAVVAPRSALRRRAARAMLSIHEAARKDRTTKDWLAPETSAESEIVADHPTILARSRQAVRDDGTAASIRESHVRHIVGTGITGRAAARTPAGKDLAAFNDAVDWYWDEWAGRAEYCDVERRKTFLAFQRLWVRDLVTAGETFVVLATDAKVRDDAPSLILQAFEAEQLNAGLTQFENREVRGGVEVDEFGAALAYHVYTRSASGTILKSDSVRIPAERVLHFLDPDRAQQTRGRPRMAPILTKMRHAGMYDQYEVLAKRMEACIGTIRYYDPNFDIPNLGWGAKTPAGSTGTDADGNSEMVFQPGMDVRLPIGERVEFVNPQRPGASYEPFSKHQGKKIASGAGLDLATMLRDWSEANYSSLRFGRLELDAELDPIQLLLITALLQPIRARFIRTLVAEGFIQPPARFWTDPQMRSACLRTSWRGPAKGDIDPAKAWAARKIALELVCTTRRDVLNELGLDWQETIEQVRDERAYAAAQDPPIEFPETKEKGGGVLPQEPRPEAGFQRRRGGNGDGFTEEFVGEVSRRAMWED